MANKTVMIIEDDVLHMKLFKDILENLGFSTLRARDEKAAMEITRITHPDLIIMDMRLPFTSSFDIVKQLKNDERLKDIAVVAITSLVDNMKKEEYLRHGFDDFLSKPIAVLNFIKTVADMFGPTHFTVH
jgi:two-component system cell cycle response regulator DivK